MTFKPLCDLCNTWHTEAEPHVRVQKDFWCVVALDYDKDEAWILDQSQDSRDCDMLDGSAGSDNYLMDGTWIKRAVPGLYRLELSPWGYENHDTEWETGIDVTEATLLVAFPPRQSESARNECVRRGIYPDEICADGGVTAEMVVTKESDAGCGSAVVTPWQESEL